MHYSLKNHTKSLILSFLILFFSSSFTPSKKENVFVVVIDAGHGGDDAGARGYGDIREKDITLEVALAFGSLIEKKFKDVKVIYTRETDVFIPLQERARIANKNKANLFISIHCNANNRREASGTETYVLGLHRNEENFEVSKRENSVIFLEENYEEKYEGFDPRSPASVIGLTLLQNTHLDNSIQFAKLMEDNFVLSNRLSRGVKQAGFLVLRKTAMPSVLIEMGFITNPEEGTYLGSEEGKSRVAEDIFDAFSLYKDFVENKAKGFSENKNTISKSQITEDKNIKIPLIKKEEKISQNTEFSNSVVNGNKLFKVQLLVSKKLYNQKSDFFKGLFPIEVEKFEDSYRYFYGKTSDILQRDELLKKAKNEGFSDAFIVEVDNPNEEKYTIQVLVSTKEYSQNYFESKGLQDVKYELQNGLYKYYYKEVSNLVEAKKHLAFVKKKISKDAFIVSK